MAIKSLHYPLVSSRCVAAAWPMFALIVMCGVWFLNRTFRKWIFFILFLISVGSFVNQAKYLAMQRMSFAVRTVSTHAGKNFGVFCYPWGSRVFMLSFPEDAVLCRLRKKDDSLILGVSPCPAINQVRVGWCINMGIQETLDRYKLPEIWFVCDTRDKSTYRGGKTVLRRVVEILSDDYQLANTFLWPGEEQPKIHIMKFVRK